MPFLIGTLLAVVIFASSQVATLTNAALPTFQKLPVLQLAYFSISPPAAPVLKNVVTACSNKQAINTVTWENNNSLTYVVFRDTTQVARTTGTTYIDNGSDTAYGFEKNKTFCYVVRGVKNDSDPKIGRVLSGNSNTMCVSTPDCSGLVAVIPTPTIAGGGSVDTPTPEPSSVTPTIAVSPTKKGTPTPSKKPTATPTSTPAACQSSTKTADGKTVVNVKSFANDIQKALDCFKNSTTGGAVYVPSGTYIISKKIGIYANVILFGDGIDKTILQAPSGFSDTMIGNDSSRGQQNIVIRDMTLNGGLSAQDDKKTGFDGIRLRDLTGGYITNVKVQQVGDHGIWLSYKPTSESPGYKAVYDFRVTNCQSLRNKGAGIWIDSGERNVVDNCVVAAEGDANGIGLEIGIDGTIAHNMVISNDVQRNGHGITLTAGNTANYSAAMINTQNIVCYNTVKNNLGPGVWDEHGKDNVYIGNIISNNNNNDGHKDVINVNSFGYEEKLPPATDPRCDIPASYAISAAPPKPSVLGAATVSNTVRMQQGVIDHVIVFFDSLLEKLSGIH